MNPKLSIALFTTALFTAVLFASCAKEPIAGAPGTHTHADGTVHKNEPEADHHGEEFPLGEVKLGTYVVQVTQAGKLEAGKEIAVDVAFAKGQAMPATMRAWIGDESAKGSMKVKLAKEREVVMHAHVEAPKPLADGSKLWIEFETADGVTGSASVALHR